MTVCRPLSVIAFLAALFILGPAYAPAFAQDSSATPAVRSPHITSIQANPDHFILDRTTFMARFAQCIGDPDTKSTASYISPQGRLGWYQISVNDAQYAGLCTIGIPAASNTPKPWSYCDFKGPLAKKFGLRTIYDLRFTPDGSKAQQEIFHHSIDRYEKALTEINYVPPKGIEVATSPQAPEMVISTMHLWGTQAGRYLVDGKALRNGRNIRVQGVAECMRVCMNRQTESNRPFQEGAMKCAL